MTLPATDDPMTPDEYQRLTKTTAIYPGGASGFTVEQIERLLKLSTLFYTVLGLNGEAGECAEVVKKGIRDGWSEESRQKLKKELGDVAWYLARASDEAGFSLQEVMDANLAKLRERKAAGRIGGSGSER